LISKKRKWRMFAFLAICYDDDDDDDDDDAKINFYFTDGIVLNKY